MGMGMRMRRKELVTNSIFVFRCGFSFFSSQELQSQLGGRRGLADVARGARVRGAELKGRQSAAL